MTSADMPNVATQLSRLDVSSLIGQTTATIPESTGLASDQLVNAFEPFWSSDGSLLLTDADTANIASTLVESDTVGAVEAAQVAAPAMLGDAPGIQAASRFAPLWAKFRGARGIAKASYGVVTPAEFAGAVMLLSAINKGQVDTARQQISKASLAESAAMQIALADMFMQGELSLEEYSAAVAVVEQKTGKTTGELIAWFDAASEEREQEPLLAAGGETSAVALLRQIGLGKTAFVVDGELARDTTPGPLAEEMGVALGQEGQQPQLFAFVADGDTALARELAGRGYRVYTAAQARELKQALREQFESGTLVTAFFIAAPETLRSPAWLLLNPPSELTLVLTGASLTANALAELLAETTLRTHFDPAAEVLRWSRV